MMANLIFLPVSPSLMTYAPSSAIWWSSYGFYTGVLGSIVPAGTPHMLVLAPSGVLSGVTAATLTNPLDIVRTRLQVSLPVYGNVRQ